MTKLQWENIFAALEQYKNDRYEIAWEAKKAIYDNALRHEKFPSFTRADMQEDYDRKSYRYNALVKDAAGLREVYNHYLGEKE